MGFKNCLKVGVFSALIGAVAGLFLAKKSGQELKQDIKVKGEEVKDKAQDVLETVSRKAEEIVSEVKNDLADNKTDVK